MQVVRCFDGGAGDVRGGLRAVVGGEGVSMAAPIDLGGLRAVAGGEGVSMAVPGVFAVVEGRCRW